MVLIQDTSGTCTAHNFSTISSYQMSSCVSDFTFALHTIKHTITHSLHNAILEHGVHDTITIGVTVTVTLF